MAAHGDHMRIHREIMDRVGRKHGDPKLSILDAAKSLGWKTTHKYGALGSPVKTHRLEHPDYPHHMLRVMKHKQLNAQSLYVERKREQMPFTGKTIERAFYDPDDDADRHDDPIWQMGYDHGARDKPNRNPFSPETVDHDSYNEGYRAGQGAGAEEKRAARLLHQMNKKPKTHRTHKHRKHS